MLTRSVPYLRARPASLLVLCLAAGLAAASLLPTPSHADSKASELVAEVAGTSLTYADLETAAATDLQQLDQQRHKILEGHLDRLVRENLVRIEAERLGQQPEGWLQAQIEARIEPVTDADIDAWYAANESRVNQPKDRVAPQIRSFLSGQRAETARNDLMAELRDRHAVRVYFQPLRLDVADAKAPTKGPEGAPVELVIFSDFQCPYCQRINPVLEQLQASYGDKLSVTFRQYPLRQMHPQAQKAAEASLCAAEQDKFWPMHDAIFGKADDLSLPTLKAHAAELGLDSARFDACLDSGAMVERVQRDFDAGQRAGVPGTPAMYVNGRAAELVRGTPPEEILGKLIDDELARTGN